MRRERGGLLGAQTRRCAPPTLPAKVGAHKGRWLCSAQGSGEKERTVVSKGYSTVIERVAHLLPTSKGGCVTKGRGRRGRHGFELLRVCIPKLICTNESGGSQRGSSCADCAARRTLAMGAGGVASGSASASAAATDQKVTICASSLEARRREKAR